MKNRILTFIIGVLVGAIIVTSGFLLYFNGTNTDAPDGSKPQTSQSEGGETPPDKPDGQQSEGGETPPDKPDGQQGEGGETPPDKPDDASQSGS